MKNSKTKPFNPIVSIEQILLYEKENPETHTASPFMNAVCDAISELGLVSGVRMARYMQLSARDFSSAVKVMTGQGYGELRLALEKILFRKLKQENPKMTDQEALKQLGMKHRSTSWRIKNNINQGTYKSKHHRYGKLYYEENIKLLEKLKYED